MCLASNLTISHTICWFSLPRYSLLVVRCYPPYAYQRKHRVEHGRKRVVCHHLEQQAGFVNSPKQEHKQALRHPKACYVVSHTCNRRKTRCTLTTNSAKPKSSTHAPSKVQPSPIIAPHALCSTWLVDPHTLAPVTEPNDSHPFNQPYDGSPTRSQARFVAHTWPELSQ